MTYLFSITKDNRNGELHYFGATYDNSKYFWSEWQLSPEDVSASRFTARLYFDRYTLKEFLAANSSSVQQTYVVSSLDNIRKSYPELFI